MSKECFEWNSQKNIANQQKHGVSFEEAVKAFSDHKRLIVRDKTHSLTEDRFFCIGKVGESILTVRFTYRGNIIRIIGAGRWRRGKRFYEEKNQIH